MRRAFTLIELLLVIGIMVLLGTASVAGYRQMQRGMEERGAIQNVNQFIRSAYQRAQIDRVPVQVYFWNETLREESDTDTLIVVGRAVAVRRAGRLSRVQGDILYDEFGDLASSRLMLDEDEDEEASSQSGATQEGNGMYLYCMDNAGKGGQFQRSVVAQTTKKPKGSGEPLLDGSSTLRDMEAYAYVVMPGGRGECQWETGSSYGFEFAEITLPRNYIFGSTYSKTTEDPVRDAGTMLFKVGRTSGSGAQSAVVEGSVAVYSLRPDASGGLKAEQVDTVEIPK